MAVRIAIAGAGGRMGQALIEATLAAEGLALPAAFDVSGSAAVDCDAGERYGKVTGVIIGANAETAAWAPPPSGPTSTPTKSASSSPPTTPIPRADNFDLYLIGEDGNGIERITRDPSFDGFPMFSPDGRQLVFASNRGGKVRGETNIFVADWVEKP